MGGVVDPSADLTAALRESEERLRLVQAAARIGSFDWNMVTGRVFRSPEYLAIQGLPAEAAELGPYDDGWVERVHPDDRETVLAWAAEDTSRPCEFSREYRIVRPDTGEVRWVSTRGEVVGDTAGRPVRMVIAQTDITDRKQGELRSQYMAGLSDALRRSATPIDAMAAACSHLGRYLGADRVGFGEIDENETLIEIRARWVVDDRPRSPERVPLSALGAAMIARFKAGEPFVGNGVDRRDHIHGLKDAAQRFKARAGIDIPLLKGGRLVAILAVHHDEPRPWSEHDVTVAKITAERTRDAVERARAEEALRASEERMRLAVAGTGLGLYDFDLPSGEGVWSDSTFALLGLPVPEDRRATVEQWRQRIHPGDLAPVWTERNEAVERGGLVSLETRIVRADTGAVRWVTVTGRVLGPPEARRSVGVVLDITERKEAELRQQFLLRVSDRLRSAENTHAATRDIADMLAGALTAETVGFAQIDAAGQVATILSGVTQGEEPAERDLRLDNGQGPLRGAAIADLVAGRTFVVADISADPRTAHAADQIREVARASAVIHVPLMRGGRVGAVLFVHSLARRDWTQTEVRLVEEVAARTWEAIGRVGAEQALRAANERLEQQVEAAVAERETALAQLHQAQKLETIGQLTGGIAHDFNNLLTPITGALDLLRHRFQSDDRLERLIGGALQSAERARVLVQRLLGFARRQPLQPVSIDVAALLHGMHDLIGSSVGRGIATRVEVAGDLPPALADPNQLELAVLNLCVNARDAMPDGGTLTIRADQADASVRITVADTGIGMDAETRARAVEPFFSTKSQDRGTGLGLSMVHGLMGQLGGTLEIDSAPGEGTRIALLLPVAAERPAPLTSKARPLGPMRPLSILLVDDEDLVRIGTAEMLRDLGHEVDTAANGAAALGKLAEAPVDLVVTDFMMPGMDGVELAERIGKAAPGTPVLLITGFIGSAEKAQHLPRLSKPFGRNELAAAIQRVVGVPA